MTFGNPWALILLALLPVFWLISRGRLRYLSRWRRRFAVGLRLLLFLLLVLALADVRLKTRSDTLTTIFLVDRSDSVSTAARDAGLKFMQEALVVKPTDDLAGVVVFGANAVVEETPRTRLSLRDIASTPRTDHTNIAAAVRLGMALFPAESQKRLVLITDGRNNLGDAKTAVQLARAAGVRLDVLNLAPTAAELPEIRLADIRAPNTLHAGERFDLQLSIESTVATQSTVQIFADGQLVAQENVNLRSGENGFIFPMVAGENGFSTFRATIIPQADTQAQNNRLDTFSLIEGPLKVLVVASSPAETANLLPALNAAGLNPVPVLPADMPFTPLALTEYAAVVLANVPATALSPSQLQLLQTYVRDLGKGLVVIGGPESYGAGGYFQTPLEETLPVDMTLKDRQRLPGMSMFMVIDKSGSMDSAGTMGIGGPKKMELAKEAIYRAVDFLAPWDRVGVVAFDSAARWVVRPVPVVDVTSIKNRVGTIRASGGTDILAGLQAAAGAIMKETSRVRHIILLTDGGADPTGILELTDELAAQDISISVIAIGDDYAPFLEDVAQRGNGRFYFSRDSATIPQIFAQEATLALKAYIIEEPFIPKRTGNSPILQGIPAVPELGGYIATSPKLTAQVILASQQDDPLLAQWQYGLGRAVAWTSDATGRWGKDWVGWDEFARFWGQVVRWTIIEGAGGSLDAQITRDAVSGKTVLTVDALDGAGNSLNGLTLVGSLVAPSLAQTALALEQIAPGRYRTTFAPDETGAYLLRLLGRSADGQLVSSATRGFVVSYSPEYAAITTEPNLPADLAALGGGTLLAPVDSATVFEHTLPPVSGSRTLWQTLLVAFALLLPLDVAVRRVMLGREQWEKVLGWIQARILNRAAMPVPSTPPVRSSAKSLLAAKKEATAATAHPPKTETPSPVVIPPAPKTERAETSSPKKEDTPRGNRLRTGRLLDAKRRTRKDRK